MPASCSLDKPVRVILKRWAKMGAYVYIRPLTSKYIDARGPMRLYWSVQVELRTTPPGRWNAEGENLDEIILKLGEEVPRDREEHYEQTAGWLMPESVLQQEIDRAKESIKTLKKQKSERPRKRPSTNLKKKRKRAAKH